MVSEVVGHVDLVCDNGATVYVIRADECNDDRVLLTISKHEIGRPLLEVRRVWVRLS